jgi:hypothetical protein
MHLVLLGSEQHFEAGFQGSAGMSTVSASAQHAPPSRKLRCRFCSGEGSDTPNDFPR